MQLVCRLVVLAVLAAGVAGCGGPEPTPSDSGIEGSVSIGPLCPVVQEGVPCPDGPHEASILVRTDSGEVVATARSGEDGRFRVNLSPGTYRLEPVPGEGGLPYADPVTAEVFAHMFTAVTISFDSGIR